MYNIEVYNHGVIYKKNFKCESNFNLFADCILSTLDITDIKYTFREEIDEIECKTILKIEII